MSNVALTWAFSARVGRASEKFILVCLANYADDDGICFPSQAAIAEATALDRKTVIAGLRRLVQVGALSDTGERRGGTRQIAVMKLALDRNEFDAPEPPKSLAEVPAGTVPKTDELPNSPENGTVPFFPPKGPVFPVKGSRFSRERVPKTGHGHSSTHQGTIKDTPLSPARAPEAVEIWNRICGTHLAAVSKLTDQRRAAFNRRFGEDFGSDLDRWADFCRDIVASSFLTGDNDRAWRADFDWAMKPANMIKILEGKFANRTARPPTRHKGPAEQWADLLNGQQSAPEQSFFDIEGEIVDE